MTNKNDSLSFSQLRRTSVFSIRAESGQCCASGTCGDDDTLSKSVKDKVVVGKFTDKCVKKSVESFNKLKDDGLEF